MGTRSGIDGSDSITGDESSNTRRVDLAAAVARCHALDIGHSYTW